MPEPRKTRWWLLGVAAVLALTAAVVLVPLLISRAAWKERQALAGMVLAGELAPDAAGIVGLPPQFRGATADGKLYVTRRAGGGTWVLFVTWRGKGSNLHG